MIDDETYNKMFLFIGAEKVGKSHIILSVGKILAALGKNILVIDTTRSQGIYSYFNYNKEVESTTALYEVKPIIRNGMEILVNYPGVHRGIDYNHLNQVDMDKYDFILVEGDKELNNQWTEYANTLFFIQNYDIQSLLCNKLILSSLGNMYRNIKLIFNQYIYCRMDKVYMISNILENRKEKYKMTMEEDIEIPFSEEDIVTSINNKLDGNISLKKYSNEFKKALFQIVNSIVKLDEKSFKKICMK